MTLNKFPTRPWVGHVARLALVGTAAVSFSAVDLSADAAAQRPHRISVDAVATSPTTAKVSWSSDPRVHQFVVRYATSRNMSGERVLRVASHNVTLPALSPGRTYFVRVRTAQPVSRALFAYGRSSVQLPTPPTSQPTEPTKPTKPTKPSGPSTSPVEVPSHSGGLGWLSGASWSGKASDPEFPAWRGRPIDITGTWNDNFDSQEKQWSVDPQYDFYASKWQGNLDNAVGGIYKDRGESWAAAANGAYDTRWGATLRNLAADWKGRPGTFYLRFAHEFNGSWYQWNVTPGEVNDFKAAWRHFRALQQQLFPAAKLVFCVNSESSGTMGTDWRNAFPGKSYVDVLSVDYYNQWPFISTQADWDNTAWKTDMWGGPRGLEAHRAFAKSQGLPLALSEWSSNGSMGDSPLFMTDLFNWLKTNAGTGPGQILYEIQFNPDGYSNDFKLYPSMKQPNASNTYRHLW